MSPSALVLALLVHALAAFALWWMSIHQSRVPPAETAIDVTFEQPKLPPPPERRKAAPAVRLGLPPPAAITAYKPSQAPSTAERTQKALAPEPPSREPAVPPPQAAATTPPSAASETPKPEPRPTVPPFRGAHVLPAPPRPEQPPFRPSPLDLSHRQQPPANARPERPSPSPFVNPADAYNRARVADNYLWQVVRKLSGYHYQANVEASEGTTVVQVVIARDGRLLDIAVVRSSGFPALDKGVVAGVRSGSPYAPLPPQIHGDRATFTLPLVSSRRR
jgi:TonB family protein